MTPSLALLRHISTRPRVLWSVTTGLLLVSAVLLQTHVAGITDVRANALPLAERIPDLERRVAMLKDQAELSSLSAAVRVGSPEERVQVYSLPKEADLDKLIAVFELLSEELSDQDILTSMSELTLSPEATPAGELETHTVTIHMTLQRRGIEEMLTLVKLSGMLTIGDALTNEERSRLVTQTELENPAGIVALEQFLSTDLLSYLREPRPAEDQLLKSFGLSGFETVLRDVIRTSLLHKGQRLLSGSLGRSLDVGRLWPLQAMDLQTIELKSGGASDWYTVKLELGLYTRGT